jgi:hypothetical protein
MTVQQSRAALRKPLSATSSTLSGVSVVSSVRVEWQWPWLPRLRECLRQKQPAGWLASLASCSKRETLTFDDLVESWYEPVQSPTVSLVLREGWGGAFSGGSLYVRGRLIRLHLHVSRPFRALLSPRASLFTK